MKIRPFRSIRAKLVLSLGVPLLVSYVALLSVDFVVNRRAAVTQMQSAILERADGAARVIDSRLAGVAQLAQTMAAAPMMTPMPAASAAAPTSTGRATALLREAANGRWVTSATVVLLGPDGTPTAYAAHRTALAGPNFAGSNPNAGGGNPNPGGPRDFGRFGRRGSTTAESTAVPAWFADVPSQTAGKWLTTAAGSRSAWYVEPIRVEGRVTGAIGLEVSLRAIRTLRPGPPDEFVRGTPSATTRPAAESRPDERGPPPFDEPRLDRGPPGERVDAQRAPPRAAPVDDGPDLAATAAASSRLATGETNDFAIFDAAGRLIVPAAAGEASPPTQTIFETADAIGSPAMADAARRAIAGESGVLSVSGLGRQIASVPDDRDHWLAMSPIPSADWFLVTAVGESQYLNPVMQRLFQRAVMLTSGLAVMLVVVIVISMRMSRRLERLDEAVERVATGDLDAPVPDPGTPDEIGRLTSGFARMTRELREHVGELTQQTAAREKVEGELRIARQIQLDLLPKTFPPFPERTDFELHAVNEPAMQVAGDFYDFFFTAGGALTIVVADVSGKGVPAALLMAVTRTLVRTLAGADRGPAEIVRGVNAALAHDSASHMFVTMFLCQYEPATGRIRYVNAGHPPPLRLRGGARPTPFCDHGSPIVGLDESGILGDFEQREETLAPGDAMLIYTDGVTDAPGATDDDFLGLPGLLDVLRDQGGASPRAVCEHLMDAVVRRKSARLRDDTTVLALRRSP